MKTVIIATFFAITLFLTGLLSAVHAQQSTGNDRYNTSSTGNTSGGTTDTSGTTSNGIDWRWLLPILAIPVIFFLFKSDNEDKRPDYRDQGIMGAKGGKTRRELDEEAGKFDDDAK